MLLTNITCIIIILLNLAGLVYLALIGFRDMSGNLNKNISKQKTQPAKYKSNSKTDNNTIEESIARDKNDMLDDLNLSDFDDLNLDDFD